MRAVSNAFLEASLSPIGYANAYMVINNSTTIDASNITEISIQEDVGDTGAFSIGTFNATEVNITVLTKALPNTITGVPIKIYFGYYIGGGYEYVPMGTFYAQAKDVTRKNYFTVIKAYDTSMRMSDGYRSTLNWNNTHTVMEVLNEIKTAYSFTLGSFGGLPPSSVTVYKTPTGTYRDVVMQMALLMGTNAKFNRSGLLDFIRTYPSAPVESYNASNYGLGDLQLASVSPISYGKLIVHYHYTSGGEEQTTTFEYTAGTGSQAIVLDTVNVGTAQETSALGSTVLGSNGMSYYGYDVTLPGQPQIDLGDTIRVEDLYGTEYDLLVMSATHTFNGAMKSTFNAVANEEDPSLDGENMGASITEQVSTINDAALYAVGKAEFASTKADEASASAQRAASSASNAATSASNAEASAQASARSASDSEASSQASANSASASAQSASQSASSASAAATSAQTAADQATNANKYANAALDQLGVIQDVIGILEWASTHGTFTLTTDTTVQEHKVYFTYNSSTGDYEPVTVAEGNPRQQGYYELSMTEAMQEFILAHLAVTSRGLWVLPNGMGTATDAQYAPNYKVLLSNDGMYVYDGAGVLVTKYGESIEFSSTRGQHIGNNNTYIYFDPSNGGSLTIGGATIRLGSQTLEQVLAEKADTSDLKQPLYGTCSTAVGTTEKAVVCTDASNLYAGLTITVKFSNANTVLAPTLNVNSLGAKAIWVENAVTSTNNCLFWNANAVITFMYDGTRFIVTDQPTAYYATCSTAAGTTAKAAPCTTCVVRKGTTVTVSMTNAHTGTSAATLYVNGQSGTARTIYVNGATVTYANANSWASGEAVPFVFNGQYWYASRGEKGTQGIQGDTGPEAVVTVYPTAINWATPSATLAVTLRVNGTIKTPSTYNWTKGTSTTSLGTNSTLNVTDLDAVYNCTVTWT